MSNNILVIKKEVRYFLLINFSLIAFISIFLFLSSSKTNSMDFAINFAGVFMYIPALSTILVLKKISKYDFNAEIEKFFKVFAIVSILRITLSIFETFLLNSIWISSIIDTIASIYLLYLVFINGQEMNDINLCFGRNSKKVASVIVLFIVIIIASNISELLSGSVHMNLQGENITNAMMGLILNFFLGFNLFFGEEFGWRYFLQPRLQKLYGKRIGVIILGFIWGIWHAPLCFILYSPKTPLYCVIGHIATCVFLGIYMSYTYMKTNNIWAPILIHLVNNSIAVIFGGSYTSEFTLQSLLYFILIYTVFFSPFLLTKEYKSDKTNELSLHQ